MTIEPQNRQYVEKDMVRMLAEEIREKAGGYPMTIMEVCGTHTMSIWRYGLKSLLCPGVTLVSGPGCPVCVTDAGTISTALALARKENVLFTCFGDMLHVPAGHDSLFRAKEEGADVRMVLSPLDALALAKKNPQRDVIFFAVGFETTAPLTASTLKLAAQTGIENFSILCAHKTMPAALCALLGTRNRIDALLCPGHVATVGGAGMFRFVSEEMGKAAAIAGFTPVEILQAVRALADMTVEGEARLVNCYPRAVTEEGNRYAQEVMTRVFTPCDAVWRGLGLIPNSGLALAGSYRKYDALTRFSFTVGELHLQQDHPACCCGAVLRGEMEPIKCPLFGKLCTPQQPAGACMVSGEGACAAAYKYKTD